MESKTADFICPSCKQLPLKVTSVDNTDDNFQFNCTNCGAVFPIIDEIPRLVDQSNYSESFGYQWNIHRKTQLDSYSGLPISRDRLYAATGWSDQSKAGQRILEAGSGAGRFTEVLVKTGADVFSFDYSRAVDANARNNGAAEKLTIFQGDIFNIPFPDESFDHVLCLGVIQHTPDPKAAFLSLVRKLKPGGTIYIDVYTQSWYHYLQWKYILRPITMHIGQEKLYNIISQLTPVLIPAARFLRKIFGRAGARLVPVVEFSHLGLEPKLNEEWAILDTFDMYSPAHDHPQSKNTVQSWFVEAGLKDVEVWSGDNGIVGKGHKDI